MELWANDVKNTVILTGKSVIVCAGWLALGAAEEPGGQGLGSKLRDHCNTYLTF